jgi:hypothetical protein
MNCLFIADRGGAFERTDRIERISFTTDLTECAYRDSELLIFEA